MQPLVFALGVLLLAITVVDLLWTTLWVDGGAGPVSSRLMASVWAVLRSVGSDSSRVLSLAGPVLIVCTFGVWIGLLWAGWTLVFAAGDPALIDTQDGGPIGWIDRLYFTAYTIFTLGIGDIVPRDGGWQIATVLATASGMLFITLGVSYVVSVLGAVSRKRSFASSVTAVGTDPETFVRTGWNGTNFDGFEFTLSSLAETVDFLAYQYKAYPILHYYHTGKARHSSSVGVAVFDEALTVLRFGIPEHHRPNTAIVENAHSSTANYLETLSEVFIHASDQAPPPPDLERLREADIPTVSNAEFDAALGDIEKRRRNLLGMVETDEREWPGGDDA